MEITLNGHIKALKKDFGFIFCESFETDYFFHQTSIVNNKIEINVGDFVSFKLRPNKNKEGSHAIEVKILKENKEKLILPPVKKKSRYLFDSKSDMIIGLRYLKEKLEYQSSKCNDKYDDSEMITEEIEDLLEVIDDLLEGPSPNVENISCSDLNNSEDSGIELKRNNINYWKNCFSLKNFGSQVEAVSSKETDKGRSLDFSIIWHEWKINERQIFYKGYTKGYFNYSFIEKGAKEQVSVYDSPPPNAHWKLKKVVQKGHAFYITSAPIREIAQSSSVPALPPKLGIIETAKRILNKHRNVTEWQREIDTKRISKITQFIGDSNNIIANSPMLFIHNEQAINIINDELIIDFGAFLKKQTKGDLNGKYIDRKLNEQKDEFGNDVYEDYRPFWIIDGQHRVRGINLNENFQDLEIPLIIFPKNFNMSNTAKIFAEINTLQKKLNPLHELYMQHRFSIDHTNEKRKFREYESFSFEDAYIAGWDQDWLDSRANHLAYEILAMLAKSGPLKNKVQFLPQNEDKNSICVSADQWVNYARVLFEKKCYKYINGDVEDYVFNPTQTEKNTKLIEIFYEEMNNYFNAWVSTCNHDDWPDKQPRWVDQSKGKALIQKKTHFILLIDLYNLVWKMAYDYKRKNKLGGIIKVNEFMEILKPFKWVDWRVKDIEDTYGGGGENGRRSLEVWMADAIIHGVQYPTNKIFNKNIKSTPGQGLTSVLDKPILEIISTNQWPTKKTPVKFKSIRPWNARYESTWSVQDKDEDIRGNAKHLVAKHLGPLDAEFTLNHEKYMDDPEIKVLTIRVDWKNSHTITGQKSIKIYK